MLGFIIVILILIFLILYIHGKIISKVERNRFKKWAKDNEYNFIYKKFLDYERENKLWN